MTTMQIQDRVLELVASVEQYAKLTKRAAEMRTGCGVVADYAHITVGLATELATLLGKGRLEVTDES